MCKLDKKIIYLVNIKFLKTNVKGRSWAKYNIGKDRSRMDIENTFSFGEI